MRFGLASKNFFLACVIINFVHLKSASGFSIFGQSNSNYTIRDKRQSNKCDGFKCKTIDGCISDEKRCDGKVDCKDGSDEFNDCKDEVQCPGYLFMCDYGACIDADKKCDGKKDCRDNSDEAHCNSNTVDKVLSNCKSDQFECHSGQCISLDDKCSGKPECDDKSDETKDTCFNMFCPGFTYQCQYGACVDGYARCNDVKDCIDNSDEEGCTTPAPPTPEPTKPTDSKPKPRPPIVGGVCTLPEHPGTGFWSVLGMASDSFYPNDKIPPNSILQFGCNDGFRLSTESEYVICDGKGWNVERMPDCLKLCPALYSTDVTPINCYDARGTEIKCTETTDGAKADFRCAPHHEPVEKPQQKRYCRNGSWNLPPPACQPVCGEKTVSATPLIVNGVEVPRGDYPWVTALYFKQENKLLNICGGSMITQKLILTAAHCVTTTDGVPQEPKLFKVAVGKYYNKYKDPRDTQAQYSDVKKVIVPSTYRGDAQRYGNDIALLVTKDVLLLSKVVQPVCFQGINDIYLSNGAVGVVTGWGYTVAGGTPSEVLREVAMPFKDESTCRSELPADFSAKYYTADKMCAGHYNRSIAVCKGDSGGGLAFKNPADGRFYVHGIVSIGGRELNQGCDIQLSSLFTKVEKHFEWIDPLASKYPK